jgi:hypothetical protein
MVTIDVLERFRARSRIGKENAYAADYDAIKSLQALASELHIAILIIHHLRKGADDGDPIDKISGTLGLSGGADAVLILDSNSTGQTIYGRGRETTILDPACGTGNFLYVSLELMKRLEGEVLEALASLSEQGRFLGYESKTIDPHQFLGLEVNPRAAAIAELVLWIGFLQWHFRTRGGVPPEPILRDFKTIKVADAVLAWSAKDLARDEHCRPIVRTDAEANRVPVWRYTNPKRPEWPVADYVVGNPPFVGGKDIRGRLGEGYAQALWAAHPHVNESADFVMYWWDRAAELLTRKGTRLKRFGLVTTNSLSQVFQRRVMENHFKAKRPVSLLMAIPDHPWTKVTRDAAAVRIAMTVAALARKRAACLK